MSSFHTIGFVLDVQNIREDDKRVWLYTPERGKLELYAKSSRRLSSKLSPQIEPLTIAECYIIHGKVDHLAGIEREERFDKLRNSLVKFGQAAWGAELVHRLTKPDHPENNIFSFIVSWMSFIENLEIDYVPLRYRCVFFIKLLNLLGYRQDFEKCLFCKTQNSYEWFFSAQDGGIFCEPCSKNIESFLSGFNEGERKFFHKSSLDDVNFSISNENAISDKISRQILDQLVGSHLNQMLNSDKFLAQIS